MLEKLELAAGIGVICGVIAEDFDILNMVVHPLTREGVKAIGGICVALFIALEIYFSRSSANAEQFARDWYAGETERLRKENNETAIFLSDRRIIDPMEFQQAMYPFAGTTYMILAAMDRESQAFASSLRHNLEQAGWALNQVGNGDDNEGVQITESGFDDPGPCSAAAEALADTLNGNRVATVTCLQNQAPPWAMQIWVGSKPKTLEMQERILVERENQKKRRSSEGLKRTGGPLSPKA